MAKIEGPWGNNEPDNPWQTVPLEEKKPRTVRIETIKNSNIQRPNISFGLIIALILLTWLSSGFYQVQPNEQGVVLRFGKYVETTDAGLHYHLPYPIETIIKVNYSQERSINLGVQDAYSTRNVAGIRNGANYANDALKSFTESHMLTGDENIVDINLTIVWKIGNVKDYLFNMRDPDQTVRVAAQSVLREIVGQSQMQDIITGDRGKIEDDTKAELQKVLDEFGSGVTVVRVKLQKADPPKQVVDAFNEVQRAKADMERYKNEAEAYRNEIVPKAKGEASKRVQDAEAYREAVVSKANGDAERFISVYNAYKNGKEVTIKRLYLETMEDVMSQANKVIINPAQNGNNVLPYLPLDKLGNNKKIAE